MSVIWKFILIFNLNILIFGCTEKKKDLSSHGLSPISTSQYSYMGPVERTIDLKLILNKAQFDSSAEIHAVVSLPYDYNQPLEYKWKLGQNVKIQKGFPLSGRISSLKKNKPVEIIITVDQFHATADTRFVRFEVFGTDPNKRIFSDGLVSSHQEKAFESIVQEVEKIHEEK